MPIINSVIRYSFKPTHLSYPPHPRAESASKNKQGMGNTQYFLLSSEQPVAFTTHYQLPALMTILFTSLVTFNHPYHYCFTINLFPQHTCKAKGPYSSTDTKLKCWDQGKHFYSFCMLLLLLCLVFSWYSIAPHFFNISTQQYWPQHWQGMYSATADLVRCLKKKSLIHVIWLLSQNTTVGD